MEWFRRRARVAELERQLRNSGIAISRASTKVSEAKWQLKKKQNALAQLEANVRAANKEGAGIPMTNVNNMRRQIANNQNALRNLEKNYNETMRKERNMRRELQNLQNPGLGAALDRVWRNEKTIH